MFTIYTYWDAELVNSVLNAIAAIMNGSDYLGLLKAVAIAGILVAAGTALARMRGEDPLVYFIMLGLFYGTLFVPKATVTVKDLRTPAIYTVSNVPLGVALFAAEISHLGKWLTETFETNFSSIDDVKFSKTGFVFGSRLVQELQLVKIRTPSLQADLVSFVKDCVNPELLDNPAALDAMMKQTDLWNFIGGGGPFALNPGRLTMVSNVPLPCVGSGGTNGAYEILTASINTEATGELAALGDRLNAGIPNASAIIAGQIPAVESALLNVSRSAQDAIKQGMVVNLMRDSQTTIAQLQGNPQAAQVALAESMSEQASTVSYAAMAKVAEGALPKLRNAVELLVLAAFPIVFVLIILAGAKAGVILKSYAMATLWIQLWAPLYAVINFMATSTDRSDFLGVMHGIAGNTIGNASLLAGTSLSNQSIAGLLTISVPIIALALVKGGEVAMSGVVTSIMGPAQQAAQRSGDAVGQGNVTGGNVSWGNVNTGSTSASNWGTNNTSFRNVGANTDDRSVRSTDPSISTRTEARGSYTTDAAGAITGMRVNAFDLGANLSATSVASRGTEDRSSDAVTAGTRHQSSLDLATGATSGQSSIAGFSRRLGQTLNSQVGHSNTTGENWEASSGSDWRSEQSTQRGLQTTEGVNHRSGVGLQGTLAGRLGIGADKAYGPYWGKGASDSKDVGFPAPPTAMPAGIGPGGAAGQGMQPPGTTPAGPFGTRDRPVTGRASMAGSAGLGASAGTNIDWTSAQQLIDTATGRDSSATSETRRHAASRVLSAAQSVMAQTTDAGERAAGQQFIADFQTAVRSADQRSASLAHDVTAGTSTVQGRSNNLTTSVSAGKPVYEALAVQVGGSPSAVLRLAQDNPSAVYGAALGTREGFVGAGGSAAFLGTDGVAQPATQASVNQLGLRNVTGLAARARSATLTFNGSAQADVAHRQAAAPSMPVNLSPAETAYTSTSAAGFGAYSSVAADQAVRAGATAAATSLYTSEHRGTGTVLANSYLGGAGYRSPQEYSNALVSAAAASPRLADTLRQIDQQGGQVSPQARDFLLSELKAHGAKKP